MKKLSCILLALLLTLCAALALAEAPVAEEAPEASAEVAEEAPAEAPEETAAVTLSADALEVAKGKTAKLTYTLAEADKKAKATWSTSDKTVATVSNGTVSGKGNGSAVITCEVKLSDGAVVSASCQVTVFTGARSLKVSASAVTVFAGETAEALTVTVSPDDAAYQGVVWSSDDESVATVDENGCITGVKAGKATVTATSVEPAQKPLTAKVKVTVNQAVTGVSLSETTARVAKGKSLKLTASVLPADATSQKLTWSTSDKTIATVSNGTVSAKKPGTVTITATAADGSGISASCKVTVYQAVTALTMSAKNGAATVGKTMKATVKVKPDDATDKSLTWSSSDTGIATVDASGTVTAVKKGKCTITATAKDGSGKKAEMTFYSEPEVGLDATTFTRKGYFGLYDRFAVTFVSQEQYRKINYIQFDVTYTYFGQSYTNSGCYTDTDKLAAGKKKRIGWWKDSRMFYATNFKVYLRVVGYTDGTKDYFSSGSTLLGWFN